jgi:hypothetical protein
MLTLWPKLNLPLDEGIGINLELDVDKTVLTSLKRRCSSKLSHQKDRNNGGLHGEFAH